MSASRDGRRNHAGVVDEVVSPQPARVGCVVLTTGARPDELAAALDSVRCQQGVDVEVVVVLNAPEELTEPDLGDAKLICPGRNLGIPGGRNLGVEALSDACELVLFLDDDGRLVDDDVLRRASDAFAHDRSLGAVSLRIVDPDTGETMRRHVPRLRVGDPRRSSEVTTFLGGASVLRVAAFRDAGGLPEEFFYAHEETSLAWRLLDRGFRIRYVGDLAMAHPALPPARHAVYHHLTARNRVLLARKHLPVAVGVLYVGLWLLVSLVRARGGRWATLRGFFDGFRAREVHRDPIRWRTIWRMTRAGRPPLL